MGKADKPDVWGIWGNYFKLGPAKGMRVGDRESRVEHSRKTQTQWTKGKDTVRPHQDVGSELKQDKSLEQKLLHQRPQGTVLGIYKECHFIEVCTPVYGKALYECQPWFVNFASVLI